MSWAVPRFDHVVTFAGASHQGNVRTSNEDVWRADPGLGLFAVADGMGGHAAGEVAARIAVIAIGNAVRTPEAMKVFDQFLETPTLDLRRQVFDVLETGAEKAHAAVLETAQTDVKRRGMGCTLDAALLLGNKAFLVHAGDGRSYLSRTNTTIQLTHDHTIHGTLVARGVMTPSQFPGKSNVLTNAVGRKGNLSVDEVFVDLGEGDRLLLCTDGVHGELGDESIISELARRGGPVDDVSAAIVAAALEKGGKDNATALVVEVGPRRVNRSISDEGLAARDATFAAHSLLLQGVPEELVRVALRAAIEVEFEQGDPVPRFFAGDRVGYIVLEGRIDSPSGWTLGPSAIAYPECLAGGGKGPELCTAGERSRALRIRADDFREICRSDVKLAAMLYERLATMLARANLPK
ncbi:MAG TPA: protein phosphatase 2C domain-containing protein [Polyangiaceae bacterium]|nr:protein phosphatase 2C domain-containing protein [Polyangiaceae bacterium]